MIDDGYLACGIPVEDYEDSDITIHVHLKDGNLIVINYILNDPCFYQGWLSIEHDVFGSHMISKIRESEFQYLSYYTRAKSGGQKVGE
jgi:hypothetical protein